MDLSNGSEWQKIYDQFHVAQPNPNKPEKYYPIFPIVIPTVLDNYTVAVNSSTTKFEPTWRYGGKVYPFVAVNGSTVFSGKYAKYYPLGINETTMFKVDKISTYYKLIVEPPRWFVNIHLEVWVFTGQDLPVNIEEKVDQVQTNLARIERKIDAIDIYGNQ